MPRRGWVGVVAGTAVLAVGCSSGARPATRPDRGPQVVGSASSCRVEGAVAGRGTTTLGVSNEGGAALTVTVLLGDRTVGGVAVPAHGSRALTAELAPGPYTVECSAGGAVVRAALQVRGTVPPPVDPRLTAAVTRYRRYVEGQVGQLVGRTEQLAAAVRAGDLALSRERYAAARPAYESIEPISESFASLDATIDGRADTVPRGQLAGFHLLEWYLWQQHRVPPPAAADALVADVRTLREQIPTLQLTPATITNGASRLLNEVARSKVTGEEERYSHLDLVDFAANVAGAQAAYRTVRPVLVDRQGTLAATIDQRFTAVQQALAAHRSGSGYVPYTKLAPAAIRGLANLVDVLAEPLSQVTGAVVG